MKRLGLTLLIVFLASFSLVFGQTQGVLDEVVVMAKRPLSEIGAQKTVFDSLALRGSIASSMADVLSYNSPVYVKNYGRATLSTVSFRGTSPGHTQVTWNGLKVNNPMLGSTDFSTIPSFLVDRASLLHGTTSVNETGGGLGGLVRLSSVPDAPEGFGFQYIQGIGSFSTFDEFLKFTFSNSKWISSTRLVLSTSPNDYPYINHDKKENIYDDNHNIIGQYHPKEKNKSGAYRDFHLLQEVYFNADGGNQFDFNGWFFSSDRELPLLTTDYGDARQFENTQRENTFRGALSWKHQRPDWSVAINGGYVHTWLAYDYRREISEDNWSTLTRSRSRINTFLLQANWTYRHGSNWIFNADASFCQHLVKSEDKNILLQNGAASVLGYDKGRSELSVSASARWQPLDRIGLSLVVREDIFGPRLSAPIPALFFDAALLNTRNLIFKASASRNYKFPSLNDLYFLPGGNPDLKNETGFSYDCGLSFHTAKSGITTFEGSATWFDSYIDNWIIWLPTAKGFFSPRNVRRVHAYGLEAAATVSLRLFEDWNFHFNGSYAWTPSINQGDKVSEADRSVGKQLPYVPRHSAAFTLRAEWKSWALGYKWNYYSERFTMSSNEFTLTGHLPAYFMNNVSLEKSFSFKPLDLQFQLAVNNLFNEDYLSVLSRPMPGINFEFFISITPRF